MLMMMIVLFFLFNLLLFSYLLNCKFAQILNEYNETTITFYAATAPVSLLQRLHPLDTLLSLDVMLYLWNRKRGQRETGEGEEKKQNKTETETVFLYVFFEWRI